MCPPPPPPPHPLLSSSGNTSLIVLELHCNWWFMVHYTYVHIWWVYVYADTLTCACSLTRRFSSHGLFRHIHFKLIRLCEVFFLLLFILKTLEEFNIFSCIDLWIQKFFLNSNFWSHMWRVEALGPVRFCLECAKYYIPSTYWSMCQVVQTLWVRD